MLLTLFSTSASSCALCLLPSASDAWTACPASVVVIDLDVRSIPESSADPSARCSAFGAASSPSFSLSLRTVVAAAAEPASPAADSFISLTPDPEFFICLSGADSLLVPEFLAPSCPDGSDDDEGAVDFSGKLDE